VTPLDPYRSTSEPAARRPDASMSLLVEAASNPVDPAYAEAAARRSLRRGEPGSPWASRAFAGLLVAALATGTVWAARELRAPEPDVLLARSLLEEEITRRSAEAQASMGEIAALSSEVEELAAQTLSATDPVLREVARLAPAVGTMPVTGPGLSVTLEDSQRAASDPEAVAERVQYVDLQVVTNGLWQAGAEAIAINGHRLTALSAVRFAGEAILVEVTPLVGPYRVEAIGDPDEMQIALARTAAARHLALLRESYGIRADVAVQRQMALPGASLPTLRVARPVGSGEDEAPAEPEPPGAPELDVGGVRHRELTGLDSRHRRGGERMAGQGT
jgi:uncharacterized protein YlxW (UPF0749 family)